MLWASPRACSKTVSYAKTARERTPFLSVYVQLKYNLKSKLVTMFPFVYSPNRVDIRTDTSSMVYKADIVIFAYARSFALWIVGRI